MTLRFGIIGLGNIGKVHLANFLAGEIPRGRVTAVASPSRGGLVLPAGVEYFADADLMIGSGRVDAVIVATPHPTHRVLGEKVLAAGLHLLMEKPITSTKLEGERLLAAPRGAQQHFAIMMSLRTHPKFIRIKELLVGGTFGELQRVQWTVTDWFRSDAYYSLNAWRATWKGEGGGVLINQALHNLDILQWLCGMPTKVRAFCSFGRDHLIEVEDNATAYLEFANGATGLFTTSTGESPGVNRLEIACTGGLILMDKERVLISRNRIDSRTYCRTTDNAFGGPDTEVEDLAIDGEYTSHIGVINNFVDAILEGRPLLTEAHEGLRSVELANAMVYSTWIGQTVALPLDAIAYQAALEKAAATSTSRKPRPRIAKVDLRKSYSI